MLETHAHADHLSAVRVMHTPGHTPACLTYVMGQDVFVGDTLFMPDYGTARCDFSGGDAAKDNGVRYIKIPIDAL